MSDLIAEREKTHGPWERTSRISQQLKKFVADELAKNDNDITGLTFAQQEAIDMACTKLARIISGNGRHRDHWLDAGNYFLLGARDCSE